MANVEHIRFYSEGHLLSAKIYRPDGSDAEGSRTGLVLCHGYTGVQDLYFPEIAARFAAQGVTVLTFDYKGWGASEGLRNRLAPFSRVMDAMAAVTRLKECDGNGFDRIGLMGWSYGGSTATVATALDERIDYVISVFGVANGPRWMRQVRDSTEWEELEAEAVRDRHDRTLEGRSRFVLRDFVLKLDPKSAAQSERKRQETGGAVGEVPLDFFDDTLVFKPETFADQLAGRPIQIVACKEDYVVPFSEAEALYAAAAEPKELVELEGYGHYDLYEGDGLDDVMERAVPFVLGR